MQGMSVNQTESAIARMTDVLRRGAAKGTVAMTIYKPGEPPIAKYTIGTSKDGFAIFGLDRHAGVEKTFAEAEDAARAMVEICGAGPANEAVDRWESDNW